MPDLQTYQQTILSASYVDAVLVNRNLALVNSGNLPQNEARINFIRLNVTALGYQMNRPDYTSSTTLTIYDRLNDLIGFDTTVNSLDPNAQIPNTVIVIVNPASYTSPIDFGWSDFSTDNSPDGGVSRNTYYNTNWKGLNPMLWLVSPMGTALFLGVDYTILPIGGIMLLSTSSMPYIFDGQELRATGYENA